MPTFAQKQSQPEKRTFSSLARSNNATFGSNHPLNPTPYLQPVLGKQTALRSLDENVDSESTDMSAARTAASTRFAYDFSQIPIYSPAAGTIQTKLAINRPGDEHEQEAEGVSEQIMRMPEPKPQRNGARDGSCTDSQMGQPDEGYQPLDLKRIGGNNSGQPAAPPLVHEVLRSPGQPLEAATRTLMEPRFGHDFSRVRVHADAEAAQSAEAIQALAYASGQNIVFRQGQYAPQTSEGQKLIAHELTHVVQQSRTGPRLARSPDDTEAASGVSTDQQIAAFDNLYNGFKTIYFSDLPLQDHSRFTDDEVAQIESRIDLLKQVAKSYYLRGLNTEGSIITHLTGDLRSRLLINKRLRPLPVEEPDHWFSHPWSYQTGPNDLLGTTSHYDTGNSFLNFFTNMYFSVGNLLTVPVNAASEVAAIPDEIIEAAGYDPGAFDFVMLMTGIEEFNASLYRSGASPEPTTPRRVPEPESTAAPKPKPTPQPESTPPPASKPSPEPESTPGKTRPTRTETNTQQAEKLLKQIEKGLEDARKPRIQKNWRNNLREMVKKYKTAVFDVGSDKIALTKERMNHILRRHHPDCWDGTVAGQQSFFDAKMTTDDIANLVRKAINQNQNKILAAGIENNITVEGVVDGYSYVVTVAHGEVAQFFIK